MTGVLQIQPDFLLFAGSVLLITAGVVALALGRRLLDLAWFWLVVFTVLFGVSRWLELAAAGAADWPGLHAASLTVRVLAFLSLLGFACHGAGRARVWFAVGVLAPQSAAALAGMVHKELGQDGLALGVLQLVVTLWAAARLYFGAGDRTPRACGSLRLAAIWLGLAGLAWGLPWLWPGGVPLSSVAGVEMPPVMLLQLLCTAGFLCALTAGLRAECAASTGGGAGLMVAGVLVVAVVLLAGAQLTALVGAYGDRVQRTLLLARAQTAGATLNADWVWDLNASPADKHRPAYRRLCAQMRALRATAPGIRFVYLLRRQNDQIVFLAESEPADSPDHSPPGQVYYEAIPELRALFDTARPCVAGPYKDRWGLWISGFAVLHNPAQPKHIAVLGLDMDARTGQRLVAQHRLAGMGLVLVLCLLMMALFGGLHISRESFQSAAASEQRFRTMIEHAPEAVFVFETDNGRIHAANPFMAAWLDYTDAELVNLRVQDLVSIPLGRFRRDILQQRAPTAAPEAPPSYRHRDGTWRPAETTGTALRFHNADCVVAFARDVTERQHAEHELRRRDALLFGVAKATQQLLTSEDFAAAMTQALATIGVADEVDRVYIFENGTLPETGEAVMSQRFEWCASSTVPQIDNPELQNVPYQLFGRWWSALGAHRPLHGLVREFPEAERPLLEQQAILSLAVFPILVGQRFWGFVGFDDCRTERVWTDAEISILQAAAGSIGGAIKRREAEAALRLRDAELRKLALVADRTDYAVIITDARGVVEWVNAGCARLTEYAAAEAVGRPYESLLPGTGAEPELLARYSRSLPEGRGFRGELPHVTPSGGRFWLQVELQPVVNERANPVNFIIIASDVTERRQAEERLRGTLAEVERFNRLMVGRETRVVELKLEVNALLRELARPPAYAPDEPRPGPSDTVKEAPPA